jgi:hypothetical protein
MMMYFVVCGRPFHFWETVWEDEAELLPSREMGLVSLRGATLGYVKRRVEGSAYLRTLMLCQLPEVSP